MKKIIGFFAVFSLSVLTGCTSMNKSAFSGPLDVNVESNLVADLAVGEKIAADVTLTRFLFFTFGHPSRFADGVSYSNASESVAGGLFRSVDPLTRVKSAAALKAMEASGADVIVAPRYTVDRQDYFIFAKVNVKVEGYKGTIKGFRGQ